MADTRGLKRDLSDFKVDLHATLLALEHRIQEKSIFIHGSSWSSEDDFFVWVQTQNVPHEAWHVWMDINSLLQCVKGRCTTQEECEHRDINLVKVKRLL